MRGDGIADNARGGRAACAVVSGGCGLYDAETWEWVSEKKDQVCVNVKLKGILDFRVPQQVTKSA